MSVIVEFLKSAPALVSAGHDGLHPYDMHPYDELFVIAYLESASLEDQRVELWLPYNEWVTIENGRDMVPEVRVHHSGFMWHDRVREIPQVRDAKWLSVYGLTLEDPRKLDNPLPEIFAVLPGSPMQDSFQELLASERWRQVRDFHTRSREWMPKNTPKITAYEANRALPDLTLIEKSLTRSHLEHILPYTLTAKSA